MSQIAASDIMNMHLPAHMKLTIKQVNWAFGMLGKISADSVLELFAYVFSRR